METQPDFELRQQLQRFSTVFADRVTQATESMERSPRMQVRDEALRKNLRYTSSAVEIAAGPFAGVNLLDMMAFIRLSRAALERHWIPELYGEEGAGLREVFARSEAELRELAQTALTMEQRDQLDQIIDGWLEENPEQVRVEGIRLTDFSAQAGTAAAATAAKAKGLLASVTSATQTANQALLVSERALFLLNRMPFLWRLQARLAAREMVRDVPLDRFLQKAQTLALRGLLLAAGAGVCVFWVRSLVRR
jgi:hypothetical protein